MNRRRFKAEEIVNKLREADVLIAQPFPPKRERGASRAIRPVQLRGTLSAYIPGTPGQPEPAGTHGDPGRHCVAAQFPQMPALSDSQ